jgi:hypothetical protein
MQPLVLSLINPAKNYETTTWHRFPKNYETTTWHRFPDLAPFPVCYSEAWCGASPANSLSPKNSIRVRKV